MEDMKQVFKVSQKEQLASIMIDTNGLIAKHGVGIPFIIM